MMGFAGAILLVFAVGTAHAFCNQLPAFTVKCKTMGAKVERHGGDGSECFALGDGTGTATTKATGGSEAHTQAFGKCDATATATGGSFANAVCEHNGTHATAVATKGGHAEGFDDKSPICIANGVSTAKVRSTFGNCGP